MLINLYNKDTTPYKFDTLQQARKDLIGEIEAVMQYDEHIQTSSDPVARQTWQDIKQEELVHIGQLLGLLNYLNPNQKSFVESGYEEFNKMINNGNSRNNGNRNNNNSNNNNNNENNNRNNNNSGNNSSNNNRNNENNDMNNNTNIPNQ